MGVEKEVTLPSTAVAKYHRIDNVPKICWTANGRGQIQIMISQYVDYEARQQGAEPLSRTLRNVDLPPDIINILRFTIYKAIMPEIEGYEGATTSQDDEMGNILRLLHYLDDRDLTLLSMAMEDIVEIKNLPVEMYREWYETRLKDDMLSVIL